MNDVLVKHKSSLCAPFVKTSIHFSSHRDPSVWRGFFFFFFFSSRLCFALNLWPFALERAALGLQPCHGEIVFIYNSFAPGWYAEAAGRGYRRHAPFVLGGFFFPPSFPRGLIGLDLTYYIITTSSFDWVRVCFCVCDARTREVTQLIKLPIRFGPANSCAAGKQWQIC